MFHDDKTNTIRVSIYSMSVLRALAAKEAATLVRGITFPVRVAMRGEAAIGSVDSNRAR